MPKTLMRRSEAPVYLPTRLRNHPKMGLRGALYTRNTELARLIIQDTEVDINEPLDQRGPALFLSIAVDHLEGVQMLLQQPQIDVNVVYKEMTPLRLALKTHRLDIFRALLAHPRIDPNLGEADRTPLFVAGKNENLPFLDALLASPAVNVNLTMAMGTTAFMCACGNNRPKVVRRLLADRRVDVNALNEQGRSALHLAVGYGHPEIIKLLLACPRILVNGMPAPRSESPLFLAIKRGNNEAVRLFVQHPRCNVNAFSQAGDTPLMAALKLGYEDIWNTLFACPRLDPNVPTKKGIFVAQQAIVSNCQWALERVLTDRRVDVNLRVPNAETLLDLVLKTGHRGLFNVLVKSPRVDINAVNIKGKTPLCSAIEHNCVWAFKSLLDSPRTDVNKGPMPATPLYIACHTSNTRALYLLLARRDLQIYQTSFLHASPLQAAASVNFTVGISSLLASPQSADPRVRPALHVALMHAARHGHKEATLLLATNRQTYPLAFPDAAAGAAVLAINHDHVDIVKLLMLACPPLATRLTLQSGQSVDLCDQAAYKGRPYMISLLNEYFKGDRPGLLGRLAMELAEGGLQIKLRRTKPTPAPRPLLSPPALPSACSAKGK